MWSYRHTLPQWNRSFRLYIPSRIVHLSDKTGWIFTSFHPSLCNPLLLHDDDIRGLGTLMNSLAPSCRRDAFQLLMSGPAHILAQRLVEVRAATILDALDVQVQLRLQVAGKPEGLPFSQVAIFTSSDFQKA